MASEGSNLLLIIISVWLPPLAVYLKFGIESKFWMNLVLTLFFFLPGTIHAIILIIQNPDAEYIDLGPRDLGPRDPHHNQLQHDQTANQGAPGGYAGGYTGGYTDNASGQGLVNPYNTNQQTHVSKRDVSASSQALPQQPDVSQVTYASQHDTSQLGVSQPPPAQVHQSTQAAEPLSEKPPL